MDTINKLQFRHCKDIIPVPAEVGTSGASETILDYIKTNWYNASAWNDPVSPYRSLYGEPVVFKYKVEGEDDVQLALAIGIETNDETGSSSYIDYNKFLFINIKGIEDNIEAIWEEIEKLIKMISITALSSDTINLHSYSDENGTIISGDVNTVAYRIANNQPKFNNLGAYGADTATIGTGLFMYVDISYDKDTEVLTFEVSDPREPNGIRTSGFTIPNNYVVSGVYDIENEQIVLTMKEGDPVTIDCVELINEWDVEGESSKTPIVLNKKRVKGFDPLMHHAHSDILSADIRVDSERPYNILEKTSNGRYLYVRGHATNIAYEWNGEAMTVNEALNDLKNIKISSDGSNILQDRADGFFACTTLDYVSSENKLIFRTTNIDGTTHKNEIELKSVDFPIEDIYYDARTETLIIKWRDQEGKIQTVKIPISDMIDEWEVLNPGHNVTLTKVHKVSGKDQLSADVNIYGSGKTEINDNNILEDRDHSLYVRGTADNIKYKNTTVEGALDNLDQKIDDETARAEAAEQALDDKIGQEIADRIADVDAEEARAKDAETELQKEIEAVSGDSRASLKHVINLPEDNSIIVVERDGRDGKEAVVNVNLSDQDHNSIRLNRDGLYVYVDIEYDPSGNTLTLWRSDKNVTDALVPHTVQLKNDISVIDHIEYDKDTEEIVIWYRDSAGELKNFRIPVKDIIEEWDVKDTFTVKLYKDRNAERNIDILTAEVNICSAHTDNILEVHRNEGLYVSGAQIEENKNNIAKISGDVINEIARAKAAEQALDEKINQEIADRKADVDEEEARAKAAEQALSGAISTEIADRIADVDAEEIRAISAETALRNDFVSGDTELDHKIDSLETTLNSRIDVTENRLQAAIDSEKSRAEAADNLLDGKISTEKERAMTVEGELRNAITAETKAREDKDAELSDKIDAATLTFEDSSSIDFITSGTNVTASVKLANAPDNIILTGDTASGKYGVYASVDFDYIPATNKIKFTVNGNEKEFTIAAGSILDDAWYDPVTKELVFKTKTADGSYVEVRVPAYDLFDDWYVVNPPENSAIELTKVTGRTDPTTHQPLPDELSGRVLISPLENNALIMDTNGLYVPNSAATIAECVSGKTDAMYTAMFGLPMPAGCGENIEYIPDTQNCIISGATSLYDADRFMAYQICEILEMWVSGMTCTSVSNWVDDGANKKMLVDVRPSYGKGMRMTDEDLYITNLSGKTIESGVTEFTDTNVLRIVCLNEGPVIPDVSTPQNGVYLSNVWDCGKYYQQSTEADEMAQVEADGYNVNYLTDESDEGNTADYSNYLRC